VHGSDLRWIWLFTAIVVDVGATIGMRANNGFGWDVLSLLVASGYVIAFYSLGRSLEHGMKIGVAYAVWGGLGLGAVAVLGAVIFSEHLTGIQFAGLGSIVVGLSLLKAGETQPREFTSDPSGTRQ